MDKVYRDIHLLKDDEEFYVMRHVLGEIKVHTNSIEIFNRFSLQNDTIVLPFDLKGVKIVID